MNLSRLATRNVLRNRGRTVLTMLGVAVAIVAFVLLQTVLTSWRRAGEYAAQDRLATRHKVSFVISLPRHYVELVRAIPGVSGATWANWFGAKDPRHPDDFFANFAVDPPTFLQVYDEIVLSPEEKAAWLADRQGAIVGDMLARRLGVKVGDRLTLTGTIFPGDWAFHVVGIYEATRRSADRSSLMFHWSYLNESLPPDRKDMVGWITSRVDDPGRGAAVSAAIDRVFDDKDIQTATMSERAMQLSFMAMVSAVLTALDVVSLIILLIMMMILGNTIAMAVRERTREYGVLRALGFGSGHVALFIVGEAAVIGVVGGLLGLALSYPVVEGGMGRWMEENMGSYFPYFRIAPSTLALALTLPLALALAAAAIPARRAARLTVTDALRRVG